MRKIDLDDAMHVLLAVFYVVMVIGFGYMMSLVVDLSLAVAFAAALGVGPFVLIWTAQLIVWGWNRYIADEGGIQNEQGRR